MRQFRSTQRLIVDEMGGVKGFEELKHYWYGNGSKGYWFRAFFYALILSWMYRLWRLQGWKIGCLAICK